MEPFPLRHPVFLQGKKKVGPFKFKLAITYCINLIDRTDECVKTQGRLHMGNELMHACLKNI